MSSIPLLGAIASFALIIVFARMLPVTFTGDALLAVVLTASLISVFVYTSLAKELAGLAR